MAYKFQVGAARLSGSLVQEGNITADGDASASNLSASSDVLAGGNLVAAGEIRGTLQRSITAGAGLSGDFDNSADVTMAVQVDDASIQITGDSLNVKDLGVTNGMLAGGIENAKLVNSSVKVDLTGAPSFLSITGLQSIALGGTGSIDYVDNDFRDSVRQRMSAADFITYATGSGVISVAGGAFTGSARSVLSAADFLTYDAASGLVDVAGGAFTGSARSVVSAADFATYDAASGVISVDGSAFTGSARSVLAPLDTNSIDASYNASSGEFSADLRLSGSTSFEIDASGLKLKSSVAGNGLALSAGGELSVNASALALDVQSTTAAGTIAGTTDVQLVNIVGGGTMTMPSPTSGKLLRIKRVGGGDVTLSGTFSDGSPIILEEVGAAVACVGDGSSWHIM